MQHLSILPILIPLIIGAALLLPPLSKHIQRQRIAALIGLFVLMLFFC